MECKTGKQLVEEGLSFHYLLEQIKKGSLVAMDLYTGQPLDFQNKEKSFREIQKLAKSATVPIKGRGETYETNPYTGKASKITTYEEAQAPKLVVRQDAPYQDWTVLLDHLSNTQHGHVYIPPEQEVVLVNGWAAYKKEIILQAEIKGEEIAREGDFMSLLDQLLGGVKNEFKGRDSKAITERLEKFKAHYPAVIETCFTLILTSIEIDDDDIIKIKKKYTKAELKEMPGNFPIPRELGREVCKKLPPLFKK